MSVYEWMFLFGDFGCIFKLNDDDWLDLQD